jgi:hypothetical protein
MIILDFLQKFEHNPVFSIADVFRVYPGFDRKNLVRWQEKGLVLKLRNKWYALPDKIRDEADLFTVASSIYTPSYVSLESAFAFYGWIPEGVFTVTSITTLKTAFFSNKTGHFRYTNLKESLFFGFWFPGNFRMAEPEKALLDYLYLHPELTAPDDFESLRWFREEISEKIDFQKLLDYAHLFNSVTLDRRVTVFKKFLDGEY